MDDLNVVIWLLIVLFGAYGAGFVRGFKGGVGWTIAQLQAVLQLGKTGMQAIKSVTGGGGSLSIGGIIGQMAPQILGKLMGGGK